jgi:hypothetical protein
LVESNPAQSVLGANANFMIWRDRLIALAARHKVAASYTTRDFVTAGGLVSYGPNLTEVYRQVGVYAGQSAIGCCVFFVAGSLLAVKTDGAIFWR